MAAVSAGARPTLSADPELSWALAELPGLPRCSVLQETSEQLRARVVAGHVERIRYFGSLDLELRTVAADSGTHIECGPVLEAGRLELLRYLREQITSHAYHRYGSLHEARLMELAAPSRAPAR